jgi:tetratricopeptide (TPR) repeat protein
MTQMVAWMGEALNRARVAELIVTHAQGRRRGSGYRVTTEAVLTAAHLLEGALSVRVRFEPDLAGEWATTAISWWADPDSDVAVLSISPRPGERPVSPVRFGRIGDRAAVLAVQAVGFPRWKIRTDDGTIPAAGDGRSRYRDAHHAVGSVAVLSNWREGTLEVAVASAPAADPSGQVSPWEGMSGAALWVGERIVGVVSKHHPGDGLARLAAARIDLAVDRCDLARRSALRALCPLLPGNSEQLPDVLPALPGQRVTTAYLAQLADVAPEHLLDRELELDELVSFCAGEKPYAWWQAGPWAGKSALLSWFVLHPPAGVEVVSFFITSRLAGQSDSDAFTDALLEQLAALTEEPPQAVLEARARRGHTLRLLQAAANRCAETGRRLVLVVDGLDEDTSTTSGIDRPSIASLLPRHPPPGVRVLIASRPHPPLPHDVPGDHPLRTLAARPLSVSPHARDIEIAANNELTRLLKGSPFHREVLGLITACGGGLTHGDLEELTGRPPYELDGLLRGVFGRSIGGRISPTPALDRPAERMYLFTHETLRETAEQQYGTSLASYRDRVHTWAAGYQARGWPTETPMYLLRGYSRLLATTGDSARLLACATDRARHDRMLDLTGGDALARTEIATTTTLIAHQPDPDLSALLQLALARDELAERNNHIPPSLPAVWVALGQPARATALAHGITDPTHRVEAFSRLIDALTNAGNHDRALALVSDAETATREITSSEARAWPLSKLAAAIAAAGNHDRAIRLAREITDPATRSRALSELATTVAAAGDHDRAMTLLKDAETVTEKITDSDARAWALSGLVAAVAAAGEHDRAMTLLRNAETATREITDPATQARVLSNLITAVATAGEHDQVRALVSDAETTIREIIDPDTRAWTLRELTTAVATAAAAGDHHRAARLAHKITDPYTRAWMVSGLVTAVAAAGNHDRARALATDTETITHKITNPRTRAWTLSELATAVAAIGDHDRARALATAAETTLRNIIDPHTRTRTLSELATAVAAIGDHDRVRALVTAAETTLREITDPHLRAWPMGGLVTAVAAIGDHDRARALVSDAETTTRNITDPNARAHTLSGLVRMVAAAGDHDRAARLAHEITDPTTRAHTLSELAAAVTAMGEHHWALALASDAETATREIPDPETRAQALSWLAAAVAAIGEHDRAMALASDAETAIREIPDPEARAWGLYGLVTAVATAGHHDRATRLAHEIANPDTRAQTLNNVTLTIIKSDEGKVVIRQKAEVSSLKTFLAEAISTPSWLLALPALAQLDPLALQTTCDVLLTQTNPP